MTRVVDHRGRAGTWRSTRALWVIRLPRIATTGGPWGVDPQRSWGAQRLRSAHAHLQMDVFLKRSLSVGGGAAAMPRTFLADRRADTGCRIRLRACCWMSACRSSARIRLPETTEVDRRRSAARQLDSAVAAAFRRPRGCPVAGLMADIHHPVGKWRIRRWPARCAASI